jgi:hypothetical protein
MGDGRGIISDTQYDSINQVDEFDAGNADISATPSAPVPATLAHCALVKEIQLVSQDTIWQFCRADSIAAAQALPAGSWATVDQGIPKVIPVNRANLKVFVKCAVTGTIQWEAYGYPLEA